MSGHAAVEPRVYRAGISRFEDSVEAVVFDLPGCFCTAADEASACTLLPVVIAEHIAWLDQHGDVTRDAFPFEVEVVERVDVASLADIAEGEFCFDDDLRPSTSDDIETSIRRMGYARQDLLTLLRPLPNQVLDWVPPARALTIDEWAPEPRSIRDIVAHMAGADGYYAMGVSDSQGAARPGAGRTDLFGERERAIDTLRALTAQDHGRLFEVRRPWQTDGHEEWTVRKALRRFISHERFHTKEIEQRLAWLLIGVPQIANVTTSSVK